VEEVLLLQGAKITEGVKNNFMNLQRLTKKVLRNLGCHSTDVRHIVGASRDTGTSGGGIIQAKGESARLNVNQKDRAQMRRATHLL